MTSATSAIISKLVLEAAGYTVDTASNGDEGLLRVKEGRYDIVFVDIQMPKMGGLELLGYLRGLRPKMPVVMLTAYGSVSRAVEAMKLGAVDFLEKPFDPKNLLLLCEEILAATKNRHEWNGRRTPPPGASWLGSARLMSRRAST